MKLMQGQIHSALHTSIYFHKAGIIVFTVFYPPTSKFHLSSTILRKIGLFFMLFSLLLAPTAHLAIACKKPDWFVFVALNSFNWQAKIVYCICTYSHTAFMLASSHGTFCRWVGSIICQCHHLLSAAVQITFHSCYVLLGCCQVDILTVRKTYPRYPAYSA